MAVIPRKTSRVQAPGPSRSIQAATAPGRALAELGSTVQGIARDVGQNIALRQAEEDKRLALADARITARRESVERMRSGRELHDFGNELFTEFESSRDFSRRDDSVEFGAAMNAKAEELIANHTGSEESKLRLMERLGPILESAADKAGVASVKAQDALVAREFEEVTNGLSARVRQGENPRVLIAEGMEFLNAEKDALRPGQETAYVQALNSRVWGAKIDGFMGTGDFDAAEEMLTFPEVRAAIGQEAQTRAFNRISAARTEGRTKILTPAELTGMGFPKDIVEAGLVVQQKADGSTNVVFNPPADREEDVRQKQIANLTDQFVRNGMDEQAAADRATNLTDGNIRIEIVPGLGVAREINELTGEVREVSLGQDSPSRRQVPKRTLYDLVKTGAIAGIVPKVEEFLGQTVGQIPGVPVAEDVIQARQEMTEAQNGLIRALSINPRFPVGEINRLREEVKIEPAILDSEKALLARMRGIHDSLSIRLANEEAAAGDPNLPQSTRASAAQSAKDIGNFLNRLGVPGEEDFTPEGVPEFSTKLPFTLDGKDVWADPDGKRYVVE